jgi:hypothetical protein
MLTLQQVFDKAAVHLLTQRARALDASGDTCMYRAPDGKMCAVGALIDDDAYHLALEGRGVVADGVSAALEASGVDMQDVGVVCMLEDLQALHDGHPAARWIDDLREIARAHSLNTEAIDAL